LLILAAGSSASAADFIAGADLSHLAFFEARGVVYKENGHPQDALLLLKQRGLTCVRLRLFTSSPEQAQADPYNYINNLDYTLPLARRVKGAGFQFLLDFHYSDTWADPSHQRKPDAWTNLTFVQLVQQMHDYNSNTIAAFQATGAMPDAVQVGNEISSGMLWPDGRVGGSYDTPTQWSQLGQLLNAAVQGIRDASGNVVPRIIVHIDRGGDWNGTKWFFDNLAQQRVTFDVVGESYYPFWGGPLASLANCLTNAAQRYGKPVVVAETGFPWTNSVWGTNIEGLTPSPAGQVTFLAALAAVEKRMPTGLNGGVLWWGAEYQHVPNLSEAGFDSASFFDAEGNVLPIAEAFGSLLQPPNLSAKLSDGNLTLQWALSNAGAYVTTATNLFPAPSWVPLSNSIQTNASGFELTLPGISDALRFYRLQSN
jgi:arabinogalactan endo-1,4-beta-galactosidase